MSALAQTVKKRFLNVRLLLLGMCFFCLQLIGLVSHAENHEQVSAPKSYMLWPLLPGETLQSLAEQLYPQSPILQQRFIQKSIALNRNHAGQSVNTINLSADTQFQSPQLIVVPQEQALKALTQRIKKAEELIATQNQAARAYDGQPFSDHRLSFQLSANSPSQPQSQTSSQINPQPSNKTAQAEPTKPVIKLPKIVFEEPPVASPDLAATGAENHETAQVEKENPSATPDKPELPNQIPTKQVETKASTKLISNLNTNLSVYWQKAKANLQANIHAFKQGNLNDWLRHPQLKWLCLEGIVLVLLVLYALIEKRLKRRELSSAKG